MKKIGYHVDRSRTLYEGLSLSLDKAEYSDCYEQSRLFNHRWQNGLSFHGRNQLSNKQVGINSFGRLNFSEINSAYIEQIVEFVRLSEFPHIPSRYESLFLVPKLSDIKHWRVLTESSYPVFEVEYDTSCPVLDGYFLRGGISEEFLFSPCSALICAENYLSGKTSSSPMPEVLARLPITIGRYVGLTDSLI